MQIFHLVPNLNYGGLQKVVQLLTGCQIQAGHSVTIGCWTNASNHPEAEEELRRAGAQVIYLRRAPDGERIYGRRVLLGKLKTELAARKPHILHVHNPFGYYIFGALAARMAGRSKIVNTVHLTAMFDHPRFGKKGNAQFWTAAMLSHGLVSVCVEVEDYLRNRFFLPRTKMFVVENGIELAPFLQVPARQLRDEIVFGFAGRMSPEKNHRVLLDAFALARSRYSNIRLKLLGGGILEPTLREQVRALNLEDIVEFCGFGHDVPAFLGGLDIYILPSDFEAHPLSLLEAIASGLPIVATAVGGVPKIVKNTECGWLCAPNNAQGMVTAMESAMACSDRLAQAERSRRQVVKHYSVDRMARDYEVVYQTLLN